MIFTFRSCANIFLVHAVSLILHAWCMHCHWHHMHGACGVIGTPCMVHAVSLTSHAKYDTACMINERFERPWQPLKGISIKNIQGGWLKRALFLKFGNQVRLFINWWFGGPEKGPFMLCWMLGKALFNDRPPAAMEPSRLRWKGLQWFCE
jgi:hypothetical protein